ncbi:MAG: hypothetical protein Q7R52_05320 [archaeon]|nr:hypothetical protein [archaeon]
MNTIDEEVGDISTEKSSRSNDYDFNKMMKLIRKFPLKNPVKFSYLPSVWTIPSYKFNNNWTC